MYIKLYNKLENELETNLFRTLYRSTEIDAYSVLQVKLETSLYFELNKRLKETTDNNLIDELYS
jgi:hypothetical protein